MISTYKLLIVGLFITLFYSIAFGYCPPDMVAYWKLDENSGNTFADSSDNAPTLPGTCAGNCPSSVSGRIDGGQQFSADTISVPADPVFDWSATDSFSIEVWIRRSGSLSGREVLVGRTESGGNPQWWVGINGSGYAYARLVAANGSGSSADISAGPNLADGAWHHIIFIRDASTSRNTLYVDGLEFDQATVNCTGGFQSAGAPVEIGSLNGVWSFGGVIDEVAIYHRALSGDQITQHYKDGSIGLRAGYCAPDDDITIMPLGDSITRGSQSTNTNGYRKPLALDLSDFSDDGDTDYYFDLVGNRSDGVGFDTDHEGHSGWVATQLTANIDSYLTSNPADVVLLHIGTNDLDDLYSGASAVAF